MTALFARARTAVTLDDALAWAAFDTAIALLASPTDYVVAAVHASACTASDRTVDLSTVFDARIFDARRELRWLHHSTGLGRAVVLTESTAHLPTSYDEEPDPIDVVDTVDTGYLLWGQATTPTHEGWTTLTAGRIGTLAIPLPTPAPGRRIQLTAREYVAVEPRHGNAYVAEERLTGLRDTDGLPARTAENT